MGFVLDLAAHVYPGLARLAATKREIPVCYCRQEPCAARRSGNATKKRLAMARMLYVQRTVFGVSIFYVGHQWGHAIPVNFAMAFHPIVPLM
ncbi:MAG: hypothetical protein ABIN58_00250 [candidate division WOR-3 bacterium]